MGTLNDYLAEKRAALNLIREVAASGTDITQTMTATGRVVGRTGVREVRIRDFQIITDTPPIWAGNDLGPSAPETFIGSLASCVLHTAVIVAVEKGLSMDAMNVEVTAKYHPVGGMPDFEHLPRGPYDLHFKLIVDSTESAERLKQLLADTERRCPVGTLLKNPMKGELINNKQKTK